MVKQSPLSNSVLANIPRPLPPPLVHMLEVFVLLVPDHVAEHNAHQLEVPGSTIKYAPAGGVCSLP
eukprot:1159972-Pelagomonas_calceolata.AAC.6